MEILFIIDQIAGMIGLTDTQLGVTLLALSLVSGVVSRIIPDDQTGVLGIVRKLASVIGLQVSNRITKGVTVNDTARMVAAEEVPQGLLGVPLIANTVMEHLNLEKVIADELEKQLKKLNPFRKPAAPKSPSKK
jgi:hypothetical protein